MSAYYCAKEATQEKGRYVNANSSLIIVTLDKKVFLSAFFLLVSRLFNCHSRGGYL